MDDVETQPRRIGPYRLLRRLGAGGLGEVWLAEDERLGRRVAVKRLHGGAGDPHNRERLRREARAAARLSHPAVARVYDLLETEAEGDALVMEHVDGPTVAELLEEGPLELARACRIARQVAEGLAAAREHGLVHRDLKAENVVVARVESGDRAKILDFGLAKRVAPEGSEGAAAEGAAVGTCRAMAPEQARGLAVDHRTDLFALGVLLYEMVTGRSPFRGATPYETLRRVVEEAPEPPGHLRPGLPPALGTLIESLLAKDPERRPTDAATVARALERIAGHPAMAEAPPSSRGARAGNLPVGSGDLAAHGEPTAEAMPFRAAPEPHRSGPSRLRRAGFAGLVAALALALAAGWWWPRPAGPPVRVAVLPPSIETVAAGAAESGADLARAAANLRISALRALVELEGVAAVDPETLGAVEGPPLEVARATAAGEVITASVAPADGRGALARVELSRMSAPDGRVLWSEAFEVPTGRQDALVTASAVAAALRRAYPGAGGGAGPAGPAVGPEGYAAFLEVRRRLDAGATDLGAELAAVEEVLEGSPRFVDAHLLAASLARALHTDTREMGFLERARDHLDRVRSLAPEDPRRFPQELKVALARGDTGAARQVLAEMERLRPGDPAILVGRSRLAEAEGDLERAVGLMLRAAELRGDWRDLFRLADLEGRLGRVADARSHLEELLSLLPGYPLALAKLAEIELTFGDPERAAALYSELASGDDAHRSDFTNLGLARLLEGRYGEAAESFRRALAMAPGHPKVLLNLADAEQARGREEAARELYGEVLARLRETAGSRALDPVEEMMRAQCLARLGDPEGAVELALATLQRAPEEAEVAYQGALVFVLAGEETSALASARRALSLGVAPRWFSLPAFGPLRERGDLPAAGEPGLPG